MIYVITGGDVRCWLTRESLVYPSRSVEVDQGSRDIGILALDPAIHNHVQVYEGKNTFIGIFATFESYFLISSQSIDVWMRTTHSV